MYISCPRPADYREVKKYGGRTPKASSHPSQPSFDVTMAELLATIKEAPKNHIEAKRQASQL